MSNTYHHYLKIPVGFIPVFPDGSQVISSYDKKLITKEFRDWIESLGLAIGSSEVFHIRPNDAGHLDHIPIHNDATEFNNHVKINFVYSDTASTMNWYTYKDTDLLETLTTPIGTGYITTPRDNCKLVYSAEVGRPSLVNTGMLHDVSPVTSTRYCFSFPLLQNGQRLIWENAVNIFQEYIVDKPN